MANNNLKTLSEIFNDKVFEIPDYQRGYSWGKPQLEDLWRDIDNLPIGKSHYTGMITVDVKDERIYHLIDGQQRLTSLVIILKNILDNYENEWITEDLEKSEAIKKYLYSKTKNSQKPKIKFCYKEKNPSFYFYKTQILNIEDKANKKFEITLYTKNLNKADDYFKSKIKNKTQKELEILFEKLTNQLKFNWYEIEKTDDLDEYVIFETMNNRGKPLSVLEILKNRLIYLTTLIENDNDDKEKLRDDINDVWKTTFEYLGKDTRMKENMFLRYHIVMYWGVAGIKNDDYTDEFLLKNIFTVQKIYLEEKDKYSSIQKLIVDFEEVYKKISQIEPILKNKTKLNGLLIEKWDLFFKIADLSNTLKEDLNINKDTQKWELEEYFQDSNYSKNYKNGNAKPNIFNSKEQQEWLASQCEKDITYTKEFINKKYMHYNFIEEYISSLRDSIQSYYYIINPQKSEYSNGIKEWLSKINNLIGTEMNEFTPILLAILNYYNEKDDVRIVKILKQIENYLFVKKYCFFKGQTWLKQDFYRVASEYNKFQHLDNIEEVLKNLIYGYSSSIQTFKVSKFREEINELIEDKKGYYSWGGINYVLYEYEIFLQEKNAAKVLWEDISEESIEHIYPQTPKSDWIDDFSNIKTDKHRSKYTNSIGNLLLLSRKKNSKASNKIFIEKKEIYLSGSFSEIEVCKYDKWTTKTINERSEKILDFMNVRWKLGLNVVDIDKLK